MVQAEYSLSTIDDAATEVVNHIQAKVVLVFGEMGAGKTTLIKALCRLSGVEEEVSSPTFALVNEYLSNSGDTVYHFDMYRIEDEEEALDFGIEEYFDSGELCLVEWPQNIASLWPDHFGVIQIQHLEEGRQLKFFPNCTFENMPKELQV